MADAPAWLVEWTARHTPPSKATNPTARTDVDEPWIVQAPGHDLSSHPGAKSRSVDPAGEGRVPVLCRLVGTHLARGDSPATVEQAVRVWAARCEPPLGEAEWLPHVERLSQKDRAKQEARAERRTPRHAAITIVEEPGDWLGVPAAIYRTNELTPPAPSPGVSSLVRSPQPEADAEPDVGWGAVSSIEPEPSEPEQSSSWPVLSDDTWYGLFGQMLASIEPETEADPVAVLAGWMACFGSITGRSAWVQLGPDRHHPAIYAALVGLSSARKGMGWGVALWPFRQADPQWAERCIANGVGSGEGLTERVRDEQRLQKPNRKSGEMEEHVIPGAADKRCLLRLDELATCFRLQRRDGSTLGPVLLTAWGGEPLEVVNRGENRLRASGYSIGCVADTQPDTLRKMLDQGGGLESVNGWMNRFLWLAVRRSKSLPLGGNITVLERHVRPLTEAMDFAKQAGAVGLTPEAEAVYSEAYDALAESGDHIPHTERAAPYVLRLALIYALADKMKAIGPEHVRAGLAVVRYGQETARMLFGKPGQSQEPEGPDPLWLRVLGTIQQQPGVSRKDIHRAFGNRLKADALAEALALLERNRTAHRRMVPPKGGGRPAECWWLGAGGDWPKGESQEGGSVSDEEDTIPHAPAPKADTPAGCERAKERINSEAGGGEPGVNSFFRRFAADAPPEPVVPGAGDGVHTEAPASAPMPVSSGPEPSAPAPAIPDRGWL